MKFTWAKEDIRCGRIICKPCSDKFFTPDGWTVKWTYKIGFCPIFNAQYVKICMGDGMTSEGKTKEEIAHWLNKEGMIPMPHKWLMETVDYLREMSE